MQKGSYSEEMHAEYLGKCHDIDATSKQPSKDKKSKEEYIQNCDKR